MGMVATLFNDAEQLNKLIIRIWQKAHYEIWRKLVELFQRRSRLKITRIYTCI